MEHSKESVWLAFAAAALPSVILQMERSDVLVCQLQGQPPYEAVRTTCAFADAMTRAWEREFGEAKFILAGIHTCYTCHAAIIGETHFSATDGRDGEFKKFCSEICENEHFRSRADGTRSHGFQSESPDNTSGHGAYQTGTIENAAAAQATGSEQTAPSNPVASKAGG